MSRPLKLALVTLATAAVSHVAVVMLLPSAIMSYVMREMATVTGTNRFYHAPLPTAARRDIVRPSPDLAYSVCVFDLSDHPVRITTPGSPTYMSVSGFSSRTDNFFAVNDREIGEQGLELLLVAAASAKPAMAGVRVVESPSTTGVVLMRRVVPSESHFAAVDEARQLARCEAFPGG